MNPEPENVAVPPRSTRFKVSTIIWVVVLGGIFLLVAGQAFLLTGTKSNSAFGIVGASVGAQPTNSQGQP